MNGAMSRRLALLEERLAVPDTASSGAGKALARKIADLAQRVHDGGRPLVDNPAESPAVRSVVAAMQDASKVGPWASPAYATCFWRQVRLKLG